jgi:hypothetical protein
MRYYRAYKTDGSVAEDLFWSLNADGDWYIKYPEKEWEFRDGPWGITELNRVLSYGKQQFNLEFREVYEEDLFLDAI